MRIALKLAKIARVSYLPRGNGGSWLDTKGRWTTFGNIGRLKLMIESADGLVQNDPMSRIPRYRGTQSILAKVELRRVVT